MTSPRDAFFAHSRTFLHFRRRFLVAAVALSLLTACHRDMRDQHRAEANERSQFFSDQRSDRPYEVGVIARDASIGDDIFMTGRQNGELVQISPRTPSLDTLQRGQQRYNIYCAPCHDRVGEGKGMIVQRGFRQPPTFHSPRLRALPDGHFFEVITEGFGTMPSYRAQISSDDRWAIVAYVRALQLSQFAPAESLSPSDQMVLHSRAEVAERIHERSESHATR